MSVSRQIFMYKQNESDHYKKQLRMKLTLLKSILGLFLLVSINAYSQEYTMKPETFEGDGALYNWRDVSCEFTWVKNPQKIYPNKSETVGRFKRKYRNGAAFLAIYGDLDFTENKIINIKVMSPKATKLNIIIGKDDTVDLVNKTYRLTGDNKWHTYSFNFAKEIKPGKEKGVYNNVKVVFDNDHESKDLDVYYFDDFELVKGK